MRQHRIRLRGGWECDWPSDDNRPRRLTLPLAFLAGDSTRIRLVRSFQKPPIDADRETLWLELEDVPGLVSVTLNGAELARPDPGTRSLCPRLDPDLPPRSQLVLDVDAVLLQNALAAGSLWGSIALVIREHAS
jgi:hypothetical protein